MNTIGRKNIIKILLANFTLFLLIGCGIHEVRNTATKIAYDIDSIAKEKKDAEEAVKDIENLSKQLDQLLNKLSISEEDIEIFCKQFRKDLGCDSATIILDNPQKYDMLSEDAMSFIADITVECCSPDTASNSTLFN